jgi:segregation and condensation protein B
LPQGFGVPQPSDAPDLREDEDPLEADAEEELDLGEPETSDSTEELTDDRAGHEQ